MVRAHEKKSFLICGTDLAECMAVTYLASKGHSVLHVDSNPQYGGNLETFFTRDLSSFIRNKPPNIKNFYQRWVKDDKSDEDDHNFRLPNMSIDLMPKFLPSGAANIPHLVASGVSDYLEFRGISSIGRISKFGILLSNVVPFTVGEVFTNKSITRQEKLEWGLFLKLISPNNIGYLETEEASDKMISSMERLSPKKREDIINLVCLFDSRIVDPIEVPPKIKLFLRSVGKLDRSPFLYPIGGTSEIHQAFCRKAAVFGATFMLGRRLSGFSQDAFGSVFAVSSVKEHSTGSLPDQSVNVEFQHAVFSLREAMHTDWIKDLFDLDSPSTKTSLNILRHVMVTTKPLVKGDNEVDVSLFIVEDENKVCNNPVFGLQLGNRTSCVPQGYWITHFWSVVSVHTKYLPSLLHKFHEFIFSKMSIDYIKELIMEIVFTIEEPQTWRWKEGQKPNWLDIIDLESPHPTMPLNIPNEHDVCKILNKLGLKDEAYKDPYQFWNERMRQSTEIFADG
eukprot:GHVP01016366.1.p2 GENE.GHVP01016366.1~~GHVP01016366.1.p2  ORF type:complete len:508 (-),score=83.44 GHVP01016366.1:135-1658(-)